MGIKAALPLEAAFPGTRSQSFISISNKLPLFS